MKLVKKFFNTILVNLHLFMMRLAIGMRNVEEDIFKADPNIAEKDQKNQKVENRNPILKKMELGQRDEKFVQDYYEVLKKADKFLRNSTPDKIETVASKYGMSLGKTDSEMRNVGRKEQPKKDKWGRRYDYFGFYDPKSKHYGKTMGEVLLLEMEERITKDDHYDVEFMFSNQPINVGIVDNDYVVEDDKLGFRELNSFEKAKKLKKPLIVSRDSKNSKNKIEELTDFVHVKRVDETLKVIEFFIPSKFKVFDYEIDSEIFKEIIDIKQIWMKDEYGVIIGYAIDDFYKRVEVIDESIKSSEDNVIYHVIKLNGKLIKDINNGK